MKQDIIINSTTSEARIALLEDDLLVELYVERPDAERMIGSIYKGVVRKVMSGISAAFIDIGFSQDAFLHFSDFSGRSELRRRVVDEKDETEVNGGTGRRRHWDPSDLKTGQEIMVQVVKEPIGRKGPRVSSHVSIPGRFLVLVPHDDFIGVSRKITKFKEKKRLRTIVSSIKPKGFGVIIRTLSENRSEDSLKADMNRVTKGWQKTERAARDLQGAGLIYRDMSMAATIIRDLFSPEVNSLIVDSHKLYREIMDYIGNVASNLTDKIHLHRERVPIFDKYNIETEIEKCLSRKIWLNGGGYIYFDPTEALVAIDVNSGRFAGKRDHEENSLKVNLAAAREISRQLRLRDVGGIIVIDFIDLLEEHNRKKVFDEMCSHMRMDRAKWDIAPIGPFGLMEMTRQRIRQSLLYTFREPCPNCDGTGLIASMETVITTLERWIKRFASKTRERRLTLTVNPEVKSFLTGGVYSRLGRIMWSNKLYISLTSDRKLKLGEFRAYSDKQRKDVTNEFMVGTAPKKG